MKRREAILLRYRRKFYRTKHASLRWWKSFYLNLQHDNVVMWDQGKPRLILPYQLQCRKNFNEAHKNGWIGRRQPKVKSLQRREE